MVGDGGDDCNGESLVDLFSGVSTIDQTPGVSGVSELGLIVNSETFCGSGARFGSLILSCG